MRASTLANLAKHSPPPHTPTRGRSALPTWVPANLPPTYNPEAQGISIQVRTRPVTDWFLITKENNGESLPQPHLKTFSTCFFSFRHCIFFFFYTTSYGLEIHWGLRTKVWVVNTVILAASAGKADLRNLFVLWGKIIDYHDLWGSVHIWYICLRMKGKKIKSKKKNFFIYL